MIEQLEADRTAVAGDDTEGSLVTLFGVIGAVVLGEGFRALAA